MKYLTTDEQIELLADVTTKLNIARVDLGAFKRRFNVVIANYDAFAENHGQLDPANATRSGFALEWQTEILFWITSVINASDQALAHQDGMTDVRFTRDDKNVRDALQHNRKALRALRDTRDDVLSTMSREYCEAVSEVLLTVHANVFRAKVDS